MGLRWRMGRRVRLGAGLFVDGWKCLEGWCSMGVLEGICGGVHGMCALGSLITKDVKHYYYI